METAAQRFYQRDFEASYLLGARRAGVDDYEPTKAERQWIARERDQALADVNRTTEFAKRDARRLSADLRSERRITRERNRVRGMRYSDGRFYRPEHYLDAQISAKNATAYNRGIIMASSRKRGVQAWEISDGPGCGLTSHEDPQVANGLVVDRDTAMSTLIAHPHCSRTFVPRPDLDAPEGGMSDKFGKAVKAALALNAAALGANVALSAAALVRQTEFVQRIMAGELRGLEIYREFAARVAQVRTVIAQTLHAGDNIIDLETRRRRTLTDNDVIEYVDSHQIDVANQRPLPQEVAHVLGLTGTEDYPTIVSRLQDWDGFREAYIRANNLDPDMEALTRLDNEAQQAIFDWIGPRSAGERFVRLSFPNMGGAGRRPRLRLLPENQDVRATLSLTKERGLVPDVRLNPNGLVRAGGQYDPTSGQFFPNLSVVPKGPLRVETRINRAGGFFVQEDGSNMARALQYAAEHNIPRSAVVPGNRIGSGAITSVSVKVRLIARMDNSLFTVANPTLNLRVNLRNLGLHTLRDIRNLSLEDFRKLKLGDLKVVSTAAEFRLRGFGPFHLSRKLRINFDDARRLYELAAKKILSDADTSPFPRRLAVREVVEGQALTAATALVSKAQSFVDTIIGLSDGRLMIDLDQVRHQLLRQIKPFAPRQVIDDFFNVLDDTAKNIFDALQSDRRVNEIIKLVANMQLDMLQRLNIKGNALARARSEVLDFFRAVPGTIRPTAEIFEFRLRALVENITAEVPQLLHHTDDLASTPAAQASAERVARLLADRFPQAPRLRFMHDDLGGVKIDEGGRFRGNLAVWRHEVDAEGRYLLRVDNDLFRLWDTEAFRRTSEIYREVNWTKYDRDDPTWVMLHEAGHHLTLTLPTEELEKLLRRTMADVASGDRSFQARILQADSDGLVRIFEEEAFQSLVRENIGEYAATHPMEMLAELFGQGTFNRRPSDLSQRFVGRLDEYWGPDAPYYRDALGTRPIPTGPARFEGDGVRRLLDMVEIDEATEVVIDFDGSGGVVDQVADKFVFWTPEHAIDEQFSIRSHRTFQQFTDTARRLASRFNRAPSVLVSGHEELPKLHGQYDHLAGSISLSTTHYRDANIARSNETLQLDILEGWSPRGVAPGTTLAEYVFVHEYGHALTLTALNRDTPALHTFVDQFSEHFMELGRLSNDGFDRNDVKFYMDHLRDVILGGRPLDDLKDFPPFLISAIEEEVSGYGSTNFMELLAEAFAEAMLAPNPGPVARMVLHWLDAEFR
jgi:hypothetical protein